MKVTVYSKKDCPNCTTAKLKLFRGGVETDVQEITDIPQYVSDMNDKYSFTVRSFPMFEFQDILYTFNELERVIGDFKHAQEKQGDAA